MIRTAVAAGLFAAALLTACSSGGSSTPSTQAVFGAAAGDNGTIKVFDEVGCGGGEAIGNQPSVTSPFSVGGTGFDPGETGTLAIATHPEGQQVFSQVVVADDGGDFCVSPIDLPAGRYRAVFAFGNGTGKQKVFEVRGGGSAPTAPPASTTTATTSAPTSTTSSSPSTSTTTTSVAGTSTTVGEPTTTGAAPTAPPVTTTAVTTAPPGPTTTVTTAPPAVTSTLPAPTPSSTSPSSSSTTAAATTTTGEVGGGGETGESTSTTAGSPGTSGGEVGDGSDGGGPPVTGSDNLLTALLGLTILLVGVGLVIAARRPAAPSDG